MNFKLLLFILCFLSFSQIAHTQQTGEVFYLYPTPGELIAVIDEGKLTFDKDLMNPVENLPRYIDTKSRNLNLGIYMADMAYAAFFSKRTKVLNYLEVIGSLSNYLLISSNIKENLVNDFTNNIDNFDSIYHFTNVYYYDIMHELESNNNTNAMTLIISGAYIECIYIAMNLAGEFSPNDDPLVQKVAEQKFAFANLVKSCELHKNNKNIDAVLKYLTDIQAIYDQIQMIEGTKREMIRTSDGKIRFKGGPKLKIEEKQFNDLKTSITRIRNEIVNNS
ncbi:MAG TPA: hypothetical protein DCG75_14460 [Bacteroidales bacterium]|jgi:hypothetical protein|nr:hypothetical protein [Bacteroidales bacterium]